MNGLTHDQYVATCRERAAQIARSILDRSEDVLEGSLELHALRAELEVEDDDPDFAAFSLVASETDALPSGNRREFWAEEALEAKEPLIRRAREWAFEAVAKECASIVRRFGGRL